MRIKVNPTMRSTRRKGIERLCDAVSFRVSPKQRQFLEQVAEEKNIGLCEAARELLDLGIKAKVEAGQC